MERKEIDFQLVYGLELEKVDDKLRVFGIVRPGVPTIRHDFGEVIEVKVKDSISSFNAISDRIGVTFKFPLFCKLMEDKNFRIVECEK